MLRGYPEIKNKCLSGFRNLFDKIWHLNLVLGWGAFYCNRTLYEIEMYESRRKEKLLVQRGEKVRKVQERRENFRARFALGVEIGKSGDAEQSSAAISCRLD